METPILAWHFLRTDGCLNYPPHTEVTVGQTLAASGRLKLCQNGMHASVRPLDALRYAPGPIICRVRCEGTIRHGDDKLVATRRTVLWMADATTTLHEMACWLAEAMLLGQALRGFAPDPRSLAAIEAKRGWLVGRVTDDELDAAWAAARDAALDAARDAAWAAARAAAVTAARAAAWAAARDAAWAAARDAAWDAALDAAWAAAWDAALDAAWDAARAAAWAAARDAENAELERRLWLLAPEGMTE